MNKIPVYKPCFFGNEKKYVNECLDSTWISSKGSFVNDFENKFASYIEVNKATTVSNGTVALHLALKVLGIGYGDEVIVPTFTYIASVNAIAMTGAKPIFVDSIKDSWNLDFTQIEKMISSRTKAVMVVHLYGLPCSMDEIVKICKEKNLFLIEDAAEAFGSVYKGNKVGTFGDIATFSFFGNKTITTGEGGMVVSNNIKLIERAAYLKSQSVSKSREYWHDELGYNYRMTNISAAIGLAQLEKADTIIRKKRQLAIWYMSELKNFPIFFQKESPSVINSYWMVSVLMTDKEIRNKVRNSLNKYYIETRPLFYPAHTMPQFRINKTFPVAESISERGMNLPSYPELKYEEIKYICSIIKSVLKG